MNVEQRIYVAGHRGMVGSAIVRALQRRGHTNIVTRSRAELELTDRAQVRDLFTAEKFDEVYLAAAKVGGIHANNAYPAEFIYSNLMIETNVIHEAWRAGVKRLLFLGSSCIYPKYAEQPMDERCLMTGALEPTNEPYAVAKIAGIKLCESYNRQYGTDFRSVMPTNLYGPGDTFHQENGHVVPSLMLRFHDAKVSRADSVTVWGSGKARREFLYVDDMAEAAVHVMSLKKEVYDAHTEPMQSHINVGTGRDVTIRELAEMVARVVGFKGEIANDAGKPDGTPRKLLDVSKLAALGWRARMGLESGLDQTYRWFCKQRGEAR